MRKFLTKSPAGLALVVFVVFVAAYLIASGLRGRQQPAEMTGPQPAGGATGASTPLPPAASTPTTPGASTPAPSTAATPTPAPAPAPAAAAKPAGGTAAKPAATPMSAGVPTGPTGRADPFVPLIQPGGPGSPPPPLVTLPPPPLPGGAIPPPPGAVPPTGPGAGIVVTGIVGNGGSVAVVVIDGHSEILSVGDSVGSLRVVKIDATRRTVRFSRAGTQFDVRMGGD